jgi:hypothetical protein
MHSALSNQIKDAFISRALSAEEPISVETYDDEGTTEHFRASHWRDHGYAQLEEMISCLSFFTPVAFCFFLPGYLLASIENPTSWFAAEVARRLCPPKNDPSRLSYSAWWSLLTQEQKLAVISFLKVMQSKYGAVPEADIACLEVHRAA